DDDVLFRFRDFPRPSSWERWKLSVPLSPDGFDALFRAVENDQALGIEATVDVTGLFQRKRQWSPISEPTDYFALPTPFVRTGKLPEATPPFSIDDLPCKWFTLSIHTGTM